jgi:hypothetical protein
MGWVGVGDGGTGGSCQSEGRYAVEWIAANADPIISCLVASILIAALYSWGRRV